MAKLKNPLFSFLARGGLGSILAFRQSHKRTVAEKKPIPVDAKSTSQLSWRHMYLKAVALWHELSASEKEDWESAARPKHMTGYAWFISQCLKPNPGIYLPLQGGTMQGDIDMAKHRLLKLPLPTDNQEPVTKKYFEDNLPVGGYTAGARVYHTADQNVPNDTHTILAFNSEAYDTDTIHDNVIFNSRLTCKTAGKYLIVANVLWHSEASGMRYLRFNLNGVTYIAVLIDSPIVASYFVQSFSTIFELAVNDYVELDVYQDSGVLLSVIAYYNASPRFMMQRIG